MRALHNRAFLIDQHDRDQMRRAYYKPAHRTQMFARYWINESLPRSTKRLASAVRSFLCCLCSRFAIHAAARHRPRLFRPVLLVMSYRGDLVRSYRSLTSQVARSTASCCPTQRCAAISLVLPKNLRLIADRSSSVPSTNCSKTG